MNRQIGWQRLALGVAAAGLVWCVSAARAEEPRPEQLREQMRKLEHKARELKEAGQEEQAQAVMREMQELREKAAHLMKKRDGDQPAGDEARAALMKKMEHTRAALKEAREAGQEERVAELQRNLHRLEEEGAKLKQRDRAHGGMPSPEQLREHMHKLEQKAKELKEAGQEDQAHAVLREMQQLREKAAHMTKKRDGEQPGGDEHRAALMQKMEHTRAALKAAREAGQDERVAELQRNLHQLEEAAGQLKRTDRERGPQPHPEQASAEQRMKHLREAIGNLRAAGLHDAAERLAQDAERMQQHLRMQQQAGGGEVERLQAQVRELQQQIRRLNERMEQKHDQR